MDKHAQDLYTVADYRKYFDEYRDVPEIDTSHMREDDPFLLHYHHYSLVMHRKHRMCLWTASNYNYLAAARRDTRPRSAFGAESWRPDPRVPRECQLVDSDIYGPAKRVDRGHIVRREDNCWGNSPGETEYANSDTYHWTNCTPQHEAFNQEHPSDRSKRGIYANGVVGAWGHLEAELVDQIRKNGGKAVLFAGPVLDKFLPDDGEGYGAEIPSKFRKVIVVPDSGKKSPQLLAYGYVLDQTRPVKEFGLTYKERVTLPDFARQRTSLQRIQELAGISFPELVLRADQAT
jgi:endonuclease G